MILFAILNTEFPAMEVNAANNNESTAETEIVNNEAAVVETDNTDTTSSSTYYFWKYELTPGCSPKCMITTKKDEFHKSEKNKKAAKYMKGCKW